MTHRLRESRCLECKKQFMARVSDLERGLGRFCSHKCRSKARWSPERRTLNIRGASDAVGPLAGRVANG